MPRLFILLLFLAGFAAPAFAQIQPGGSGQARRINTEYRGIQLSSVLYEPPAVAQEPALFVVLHGCTQSASVMATGTRFNQAADQSGFYVLYPEQSYSRHILPCWNWYLPENLKRDSGELSVIAKAVADTARSLGISARRVFAAGLSAGSIMALNLAYCYSDQIKGVMVHSGIEYGAAENLDQAKYAMANTSPTDVRISAEKAYKCAPRRVTPLPVLVFHGSRDRTVILENSAKVRDQALLVNDYLDDGQANGSLRVQARATNFPAAKGKYPARILDYHIGGKSLVRTVSLIGMGHGWSGGSRQASYMDPRGLDATNIAVQYFLNQSL